jgi:SNF2 family DNA or RNA helicase
MALYGVSENIPHRYIMTGFPVTENLVELYSQIKFLDRGKVFGKSYYAFVNRYFVRMGQKLIVKKRAIKQILDLIKPFCIRITNENLKLPPKTYKKLSIELTDQQKTLLEQLNDTFRLELGKVKIDTKYIFTLISKSLQICDGFIQHIEYEYKEVNGKKVKTNKVLSSELEIVDTGKDEVLIETLDQIDVTRNKVVIWCAFLFSVKKLERILGKLGIRTLSLTGATEDSNKVVQVFQRSKEYNVLICTQKKAAESVTLTSAKFAIYYSNIWSYDARGNSEARIRRKGSEIHKHIMYVDLITKSKVEEHIYECLRKKKDLINELKSAFLEMKR